METNNYYQIYIEKTRRLVRTLTIKSEESALGLNKQLYNDLGYETIDVYPETWKYYLNVSGEYHPTDKKMYVVSADTLETIEFTKDNLKIHRATARNYQYGTRRYLELVDLYPGQELLIRGILYPADIRHAIESKDGTILSYQKDLVEPNEYSLMNKLQNWIYGFKVRWDNRAFAITDSLYSATVLGIMYINLVSVIRNFRLEACKTNEAHSYHVKQYLASHGMLDRFIDEMTLKQTLFFYRNIAYIERNPGQANIFEWLIQNVLTDRRIPISEYTMRHDLSNQLQNIYPELIFNKKSINGIESINQLLSVNLQQMLDKQDKNARDNPKYKQSVLPTIRETMENSTSNVVMTKMLESTMVDTDGAKKYKLEDILVNHWLSLSANDQYRAIVNVTDPKNGEKIPLTAKDAFVLSFYALCRSRGLEVNEIPKLIANRVQTVKRNI